MLKIKIGFSEVKVVRVRVRVNPNPNHEQLILDKQTNKCCHCFSGNVRVSSAGVDREVADSLRIVIRAGREDCGVNTTVGDGNQSKKSSSICY